MSTSGTAEIGLTEKEKDRFSTARVKSRDLYFSGMERICQPGRKIAGGDCTFFQIKKEHTHKSLAP